MLTRSAATKEAKSNPRPLPPIRSSGSPRAHDCAFHKCACYGHDSGLPDYKLLAQPRTNNYYAATGGCPCIPRAAAHPGSWRLKAAQTRSSTYRCHHGCVQKVQASNAPASCCHHSGHQYGWRPGPHTVQGKNTAATGKCDTFGNMAFKSNSAAFQPALRDDMSDVSSVGPRKLEDLEALILEEHAARMNVEEDVYQLHEIETNDTAHLFLSDNERLRRLAAQISEDELKELLREVKSIVNRPLNQTNIDRLRRIIRRQELLQQQRQAKAVSLS